MKTRDDQHGHAQTDLRTRTAQRRRRLVGVLAATGAGPMLLNLPDGWTRPAVESVLLPAHGQTTGESNEPNEPPAEPDLSDGAFELSSGIVLQSPDRTILDYFHGTAHAGADADFEIAHTCLQLLEGALYPGDVGVVVVSTDCLAEYQGLDGIPLGGSADADSIIGSLTTDDEGCQEALSPATIMFESVTGIAPDRTIRIQFTTSEGTQVIDCPEIGSCR